MVGRSSVAAMTDDTKHVGTRAAVAAGALFFDDQDRVMMVKPTYKDYWDVPGGYVEEGESPRAACVREVYEELGLRLDVGRLIAIDWAPHPQEGDKLLFLFDGGVLDRDTRARVRLQRTEVSEYQYVAALEFHARTIHRLAERITRAHEARMNGVFVYLENGVPAPLLQ